MQFIAALALLAGFAAAQSSGTSTVTATQTRTITSCASSVSNCPASSSTVSPSPVSVSSCPTIATCTVTVTLPYVAPSSTASSVGTVRPYSTGALKPTPSMFMGAANTNNAGAFVAGAGVLAALLF